MNSCRNVGRQGPRRGCPNQEGFAISADQGELDKQAGMNNLDIAFSDDFVLGQAGTAAGTPGHHVPALVDQTLFVACLQEVPDHVVVFVRLRMVRVVPVHPVSEPL